MKAAVLETVGTPMPVVEIVLDSLEPYELVIRTSATGLCHSDLHFMQGSYTTTLPTVLGHEAAGVVERVGSAVTSVTPGDHVIVFCAPSCGRCRQCLEGRVQLCTNQPLGRPDGSHPRLTHDGDAVGAFCGLGTFAEQMLVYESSIVKIRDDMPLEKAALISCAVMTGFGAAAFTAKVQPGQSVAVIGAGGIGLNAIQGSRFLGARQIIAIDTSADNLALARVFGATEVINASNTNVVDAVLELTGEGVDHAIEAIGLKATAEQAFAMLRKGGTATVVGMIPPDQKLEIPPYQLLLEKRIQGSQMGSANFRVHLPLLVDLYLDGRLELDALLAQEISLEQINDGFATVAAGRRARSIVRF